LGANGSGKSTLAKAVCNILPHTGKVKVGDFTVEGAKASRVAKVIGYIPQHSGISIDIPVIEVVMMGFNVGLKLLEHPTKAMRDQAGEMLEYLGMGDRIHENFMHLSEGQKQLVILARALVGEGKILVMDEPESALDFNVRYRMMQTIRTHLFKGSRAGLVILHDTMLALNHCDRLLLLKDRKIVGNIDLHSDTIESIEVELRKIYGDISLAKVKSKKGREHLVMVSDSEDE